MILKMTNPFPKGSDLATVYEATDRNSHFHKTYQSNDTLLPYQRGRKKTVLHVLVPEEPIRTQTSPGLQVEMSLFFQNIYLALLCCTSIAKMGEKK